MNVELEKQLCRDYPATYSSLARRKIYNLSELLGADLRGTELITAFGIEHGDGWYAIVREFAAAAEPFCRETGAHVVQQKEKFGTLTIYTNHGSDEIFAAIAHAEKASEKICEECGAPAELTMSDRGWCSTLCSDCGSPAMRYIMRRANIERLLHYVFEPCLAPGEIAMWRTVLLRGIGGPNA